MTFFYHFLTALAVLLLIGGCSDTETPLEPVDITGKPRSPLAGAKTPAMPAAPAAPQAPTAPTDGTPFVKAVGYYSNWKLTKPLTPADTVAPGTTIYTQVVFSQPMQHIAADDKTARPVLSYQIAGERTRYHITPHGATGTAFTTGDAKPKARTTDTFICKYTVQAADTGLFTLAVGKRSADTAGNTLAAFYVHSSKLRLGQSRSAADIHLSSHSIDENSPPNTVIGVFETPVGVDLRYHLRKGPKILFSITANNALIAKRTFDYERDTTVYMLTVRERNSATGQGLTKVVTILVNDVNEAPTDLQLTGNTFYKEDGVGSKIGEVIVVDEDRGDMHEVEVVKGQDYVEFVDGSLKVVKPFDTETKDVTLKVTDSGGETYEEHFKITQQTRYVSPPEPSQPSEPSEPSDPYEPSEPYDPPSDPDPPQEPTPPPKPGGGIDSQ